MKFGKRRCLLFLLLVALIFITIYLNPTRARGLEGFNGTGTGTGTDTGTGTETNFLALAMLIQKNQQGIKSELTSLKGDVVTLQQKVASINKLIEQAKNTQ